MSICVHIYTFICRIYVCLLSEKEMATHCSTHAWKIPWMEKPGGIVHGVTKSWTRLSDFTILVCVCVCVCIFKVKSNMCPKLIKLLFYQKETLNGVN